MSAEDKRVERTPEEVAAQREVKKSEDNIRKLESKLNKLADGPEKAETQAEIARLKARITELCSQFGIESKADKKAAAKNAKDGVAASPADATSTDAAPVASGAPAAAVAEPVAADESKRVERSPEAVAAQREVKKSEDNIRKLESKLNKLADGPEKAETQAEIDRLKARIAELCSQFGIESKADKKAAASSKKDGPTQIDYSCSTTSSKPLDATALAKALEECKAKLMATNDANEMIALKAQLATLLDACIAMATAPPATSVATPTSASSSASPTPPPPAAAAAPKKEKEMPTDTVPLEVKPLGPIESDAISEAIHPRFIDLAIRTRLLQIVGGNARTLALVDAIVAFIDDEKTLKSVKVMGPREKNALLRLLAMNIEVVAKARPLCQGMLYVVSAFNTRIHCGEFVEESSFVHDQVRTVVKEIGDGIAQSIKDLAEKNTHEVGDNDTILVYGRSSSIEALLRSVGIARAKTSSRLKVIILDSAPLFEGRGLAKRLQSHGVAVRYSLASAASQLMPLCTKVFLGASAVMQSGDVVGRCGTAMIAACAKASQRPVFVFAEEHKLTREVWIGSLTRNEPANKAFPALAGETVHQQRLFGHSAVPNGHLYDVTPSGFIDVIITRKGRAHPTAVVSLLFETDDEDGAGERTREEEADEE